ncbi:MAG: histidine kinase dimerization/phospho-acceptor domain-containing protein, partial [Spirochaetales bacterium]
MKVKRSLHRYQSFAFALIFAITLADTLLVSALHLPLGWALLLQGVLFLLPTTLFFLFFLKEWEKPLQQILRVSERYAQGDLEPTLQLTQPYEFRVLGETLSWMARELKNRIDTIAFQRNELEGILRGMSEAVILLDREDRIHTMNQAGESLIGITVLEGKGKSIYQVFPSEDLKSFIAKIRETGEEQEQTLSHVSRGRTLYLQAHGNLLLTPKEGESRLLLVLNDITRIKQLEEMRKDFVANVSHELRTPITSILGFVETLKEGALQDPVQTERFLSIIENQTRRLNALIEDLLSLSRLEQTETRIRKDWTSIAEIFEEVRTLCQEKAQAKGIQLSFSISTGEEDSLYCNPLLMVQALVNLVENAIKYGDPASTVYIKANKEEG